MRILFFSPYFYPYISGITTYPLKILTYLSKSHSVRVITFRHADKLALEEKIHGLEVQRLRYNLKISKGFISFASLSEFLKNAKRADTIILNIPNFEGLPLAVFAKLFGKKIICIFHCEVFLGSGFFARLVNFFLNLSVYLQLWLSDSIVAYTEDYVNNVNIGRLFSKKISYVLPPVEKLPVSKSKLKELLKLKDSGVWIGYAGRIAKEKGLEYLIEAIHNSEFIIQNSCLVFAGPFGKDVAGEEGYFLKIKNLLEKNKIKYYFSGNLSAGDLGAFYKAIDILVLPSVNKTEAFGMVQVDSMLLGTPVVASDLPGVRIPVKLSGMGKIVKPANAGEINSAISEILNNRKKYVNIKISNKAAELFNIKNTYTFYDQLLSGKISGK